MWGQPPRLSPERSEAFLTDYHGRDLAVTAELALDRVGNFLALRSSNLSNLGAYSLSFVPLTKGTELMSSLYRIPTAHARARAVFSNTSPTTAYRSAGRPEVMFVMERLIDLAARAHGFDRLGLAHRDQRHVLRPPLRLDRCGGDLLAHPAQIVRDRRDVTQRLGNRHTASPR